MTPVKETKETKEEKGKYFYALGRRKRAISTVRVLTNGKGVVTVNNRPMEEYFPVFEYQKIVTAPFRQVGQEDKLDASIRVYGGGVKSQADAALLGIARALVKLNPNYQKSLKKAGFLTRDSRRQERKKSGLKSARVPVQWRKR